MGLRDRKALLLSLSLLVLVACGEEQTPSLPSQLPEDAVEGLPQAAPPHALLLEREKQGPYLERTVERFRAMPSAGQLKSVLWSASGGKLETQGLQATWTLPRAGDASLTLTAETQDGTRLTETYQFRVTAEASSLAGDATANVPLAPVPVDTSSDVTGEFCELAFDPAGNGHIIYSKTPHDSIWYGFWNGTTWSNQQVDGPGYNTGGLINGPMALAVDATGKPHMVYVLSGWVWYATWNGSAWVREVVETAAVPAISATQVGIALDPSQGNRPTIAYTWLGAIPSGGNYHRTAIAYRTGPGAWTVSLVTFPTVSANVHQDFHGEMLFDSTGTLFMPVGNGALGAWKSNVSPTVLEFGTSLYSYRHVSLARSSNGHLLMRWDATLLDVTIANPLSSSTYKGSDIETSANYVGDLIFAAGKPQEAHLHGTKLEWVTPNASNYWTYTDLGTAEGSTRISLAQRPTTGVVHFCYQSGSKVTFQ